MDIINIEDKILAKMAPENLAVKLMALPASSRIEILLSRDDAAAVVHAIPEQDFYICVKELVGDEARSLLALGNFQQIQHILDIEAWHKDEVNPGKALSWLAEIVKASDQRFLEWLYNVDYELLVVLCKRWMEVGTLPAGAEIADMPDDFPQKTIDDEFYFEIKYPQFEEFIRSILNFLFETHHEFYRELLSHVIHGLKSELEELAFQFHRGRLEDNAIPDFQEASSIYYPLDKIDTVRMRIDKASSSDTTPVPIFAMMLVPHNDLLTEAMALVDNGSIRRTLQIEFASLANKIIVADQIDLDDPGNLRLAADKAAAYVNLGLDCQCQGSVQKAHSLLNTIYIEGLFRMAQGKLAGLSKRINTILSHGWLSRWPHGLNGLDLELQEQVSLLLEKTPRMVKAETAIRPEGEDFIRTRADLALAVQIVTTLETLGPLFDDLEKENGGDWLSFDSGLWRKGQLNSLHSVTLKHLLFTAAAQEIVLKRWDPAPLPVELWPETVPYLSPDAIEDVLFKRLDYLFSAESEKGLLRAYLGPLIQNYRDEMKCMSGENLPEAQYNTFFLFTEIGND